MLVEGRNVVKGPIFVNQDGRYIDRRQNTRPTTWGVLGLSLTFIGVRFAAYVCGRWRSIGGANVKTVQERHSGVT